MKQKYEKIKHKSAFQKNVFFTTLIVIIIHTCSFTAVSAVCWV